MNANLKLLKPLSSAALLLLASHALTACMSTTPVWDKHFGEAVTTVSRAQVINPNAPANLPPADGVDGKAAVAAMMNYDRSLYRFGTGGAGGAGGSGGVGFGGGGYGGVGMSGGGSR